MRCERCDIEKWVTLRYRPRQESSILSWLYNILGIRSYAVFLCDDCYELEKVIP